MAGPPSIPSLQARVGEREREVAAVELRRHYVEGRLREDELERRLHDVERAVTRADLLAALRDLPGSAARALVAPTRDRGVATARRVDRVAIRAHGATFAGLNGGAVAVWAALGSGAFWPAAVLVPTGLLLSGHVAARRGVRRAIARRRER